jgi:hypothetical protein
MADDKRTAWLQKLDEKCPYQVVLPRRQLMDDSAVVDFLLAYVGKFDLYVEDQCPAYVRYCFEEPMDAAIFRSRFAAKSERPHPPGAAIAARPEQLSRYSLKAKDDQGFVNLKQILISTV